MGVNLKSLIGKLNDSTRSANASSSKKVARPMVRRTWVLGENLSRASSQRSLR